MVRQKWNQLNPLGKAFAAVLFVMSIFSTIGIGANYAEAQPWWAAASVAIVYWIGSLTLQNWLLFQLTKRFRYD